MASLSTGIVAQSTGSALEVGQKLVKTEFLNQHDEAGSITANTRLLIFVAGGGAGEIVHEVLEKRGDAYLTSNQIAVVADVHRMPSIITALFAKPRMQNYSYKMFLIHEQGEGDSFPRQAEKVTVLQLDQRKIREINFAGNAADLRALLPD